jgi:hypothetical protein
MLVPLNAGDTQPSSGRDYLHARHLHEGFLLGPGFDGDSRAARRADQEEVSHEEANASRSRNETPTSM